MFVVRSSSLSSLLPPALLQVLSFFSRHQVSAEAIGQAVAAQAPDATLRVVSVSN